MILFETEKLFTRKLILLLSLMVLALLLIRFYSRCGMLAYVDRELYLSYRDTYRGLEPEKAERKLKADAEDLSSGIMIRIMKEAGTPEEQLEIMYSLQAEERGMTEEEYTAYVLEQLETVQDPEKVSIVLNTLSTQYEYRRTYQTFLEEFPERAENLKNMSAFSGTNSYAYRFIDKSLKDYGKLETVEITPDLENGVKAMAENDHSLIFIIALILLSCAVVFSEEEGSGEHRIYLTTRKGQ